MMTLYFPRWCPVYTPETKKSAQHVLSCYLRRLFRGTKSVVFKIQPPVLAAFGLSFAHSLAEAGSSRSYGLRVREESRD